MRIKIKGTSGKEYFFEGLYSSTENIEENSGIYAILDKLPNSLNLLDVGESAFIKKRLDTHDRKDEWHSNAKGIIKYAVLYTYRLHKEGRMDIEQDIRTNYKKLCGKR